MSDPQTTHLCYSRGCKTIITNNFSIFNILFFEFFGTLFFAYGVLVCTSGFIIPLTSNMAGVFASSFISLSLFLAICVGAQFSGGHFNPAVTLGFMLRSGSDRIPVVKGLTYMAAQILGAWFGALAAWTVTDIGNAPLIGTMPWKYVWYAFGAEILGTFLFVFFILVVATPQTSFCKSDVEIFVVIPIFLMIARQYSYRSQGLNPAFAFAFEFFYSAYNNKWFLFKYVWATFFGPFIGAALAAGFFDCFYRRFLLMYKQRQQADNNYKKLKEQV